LTARLRILLAIVVLVLAVATQAAAQPTISDNFTANLSANADRSTVLELLDQSSTVNVVAGSETFKEYSWFTGSEVQFNFTNPTDIVFQEPYPASTGLFDFLAGAHQNGTCTSNGRTGTEWIFDPASGPATEIDFCANGNTPIDELWNLGAQGTVTVEFDTFIAGVPAPSNFIPEPSSLSPVALALGCGAVVRRKRGGRPKRANTYANELHAM
jgi:hypothetical protein